MPQVWSHYFDEFNPAQTVDKYFHRWAADRGSKYNTFISSQRHLGRPDDEIKAGIMEQWAAKGREASSDGTRLHREIELFLNGQSRSNWSGEFQAFRTWLEQEAIPMDWRPLRTEWSIWDEEPEPLQSVMIPPCGMRAACLIHLLNMLRHVGIVFQAIHDTRI